MRKVVFILFVMLSFQCREKYEVILDNPGQGLLVVEGIINANGPTTIRLSRTTKLSEQGTVPENGAKLFVEGEDNSVLPLDEQDSGKYFAPDVPVNIQTKYRLKIITNNNKVYNSDFREVLLSQEIDSVSYQLENDGVQFYVNSTENTKAKYYYKWEYEETWEYHASNRVALKFMAEPLPDGTHKVDLGYYDSVTYSVYNPLYYCWQSRISNDIDIGTTSQLNESKIFLPVKFIRRDAWELSYLYSLLVKQYALSAEGYEFYRKMKKNSESLGSIFDAQPSEIVGNISCANDPEEMVIGFVEVSTMKEKRLFVRGEELPGTPYYADCRVFGGQNSQYRYPFANSPEVRAYVYDILKMVPTTPAETIGRGVISFYAALPRCADCTLRGTNVKPSFWP